MKKLHIAAIAAAFTLVSGVAMAQSSPPGSAADSSKSTGTPASQMNKSGGMKQDSMGKGSATTGSAMQDNNRGTAQSGKEAPAGNAAAPTKQGATKEAN